jgi:hypothetical protein
MKIRAYTRKMPGADREVYKYIHDQLKRLWRDSVSQFILAASEQVHIDTGMSLASLQPLAAKVRLSSFLARSLEGRSAQRGVYNMAGDYDPSGFRSRAHGRLLGRRAYNLEFGTPKNPHLRFEFNIVVFQWRVNELGMIGREPWNALKHGEEAFKAFFNTKYSEYLSGRKIASLMLGIKGI